MPCRPRRPTPTSLPCALADRAPFRSFDAAGTPVAEHCHPSQRQPVTVRPRWRRKNWTTLSASNRGTSFVRAGVGVQRLLLRGEGVEQRQPASREMCSSSRWSTNSIGTVIRRAASASESYQNMPRTATVIRGSAATSGAPDRGAQVQPVVADRPVGGDLRQLLQGVQRGPPPGS